MRTYRPAAGRKESLGFTLIEVCVALAIGVMVMAGMFKGYNVASRRAQYSAYQLAATQMAMQQMETIVAATWVVSGTTITNVFNPSLTNSQINALCMPNSGTNVVYATNYATVTQVSANPPYLQVQVSCVWNFMDLGTYTNTVAVLRGPDL